MVVVVFILLLLILLLIFFYYHYIDARKYSSRIDMQTHAGNGRR